ncbi:MAG: hypothetical protein H6739_21960 [Alphaproteobacteria bacterium]|nr:hypothetical protein [Alphaproteobacteria bacterium]
MKPGWTAALALAALNGALALAHPPPTAALAWVHPVAPPLTRIAAMGEHTLDPSRPPPPPAGQALQALGPLIQGQGTPAQRQLMGQARGAEGRIHPLVGRTQALRLAVELDAVALADALGPERLAVIVARKEALSAAVGEQKVWADLARELEP